MNDNLPLTDPPPAGPANHVDVDIDDVILSLDEHHISLSRYIDDHWDDLDVNHLARLLALHGQNAARIGHLLHDRRAIHGDPGNPYEMAMTQALALVDLMTNLDLVDDETHAAIERGDLSGPPIDVDHLIVDLHDKQTRLSQYILAHQHDLDPKSLVRLSTVYSQNATRIGRLLRTRHALYGDSFDSYDEILARANVTADEVDAMCSRALTNGVFGTLWDDLSPVQHDQILDGESETDLLDPE